MKLSTEQSKKDTGQTLYILDEPGTGLHFQDIEHLLDMIHKLVDKGNTALIIEHNLNIVKADDHLIDLGPEGSSGGGQIVAQGPPSEVAKMKKGYTAKFFEGGAGGKID